MQGRIAILKVHSRGKTLAKDVDFEKIARRTPGVRPMWRFVAALVLGRHLCKHGLLPITCIAFPPHHASSRVDSLTNSLWGAGFTGADLQNLMNESAIMAARRGLKEISKEEIADALERIVAGPEKKGAVVSDAKKKLVAYHEVDPPPPPPLQLPFLFC